MRSQLSRAPSVTRKAQVTFQKQEKDEDEMVGGEDDDDAEDDAEDDKQVQSLLEGSNGTDSPIYAAWRRCLPSYKSFRVSQSPC